jgi:hypothetical protein
LIVVVQRKLILGKVVAGFKGFYRRTNAAFGIFFSEISTYLGNILLVLNLCVQRGNVVQVADI